MHPQAIASVIADEIRQQHELYHVVRLAPSHDRPQPASREEWEQALEAAYWQGTLSRVHVLDPEAVVHRCYTVYQSCVYEAMTREQQCALAENRLLLSGQPEQHLFALHLNPKKPLPSTDPALAHYREHASAHQVSEIEQAVYKAHIQLDWAIEAQLSHTLAKGVQYYAEKSSAEFQDIAQHMATRCVQEIGNVILGAVGTTLPAYASFLGVLHWSGQGYEVDFNPSSTMVDTLEIAAMHRARASRM